MPGARAVSQVIPCGSNSVGDGPCPPPGDSTLGTLSQDRSPLSESKRPVERPSSCDTGHNARLATKGLTDQCTLNMPRSHRYPVLGATDHTGYSDHTGHTDHTGFTEFNGNTGRIGQTSPHWSESSIGKGRPVPGPV